MKYQRPAATKVRGETSEKADVGRLVIDETVKPTKKVRREPHVGRIEDMKVEESPKQEGVYPSEPHIGSLLVKDAPIERECYEVGFLIKRTSWMGTAYHKPKHKLRAMHSISKIAIITKQNKNNACSPNASQTSGLKSYL